VITHVSPCKVIQDHLNQNDRSAKLMNSFKYCFQNIRLYHTDIIVMSSE